MSNVSIGAKFKIVVWFEPDKVLFQRLGDWGFLGYPRPSLVKGKKWVQR